MNKLIVILSLALASTMVLAESNSTFSVETFEVAEHGYGVPAGVRGGGDVGGIGNGSGMGIMGFQNQDPLRPSALEQAGQVISTARDIVAVGEAVYELVKKGKPTNTTEYAPISVVPRDPTTKEIVDVFDMENCSMPVTRKYTTVIKNALKEAVRFEYMVIYTYGCSYNGAGKYIQTAMVQPVSVKTAFGWDFNATMKLTGIMNHGTKADPVVGAFLTMKYQMNSWSKSFERNDTIHITGRGEVKTYAQ